MLFFQVVVRARPISGKEAAKPDFGRCLRQEGAHAITWLGQPETRFTFDHVAGDNISQVSKQSINELALWVSEFE